MWQKRSEHLTTVFTVRESLVLERRSLVRTPGILSVRTPGTTILSVKTLFLVCFEFSTVFFHYSRAVLFRHISITSCDIDTAPSATRNYTHPRTVFASFTWVRTFHHTSSCNLHVCIMDWNCTACLHAKGV